MCKFIRESCLFNQTLFVETQGEALLRKVTLCIYLHCSWITLQNKWTHFKKKMFFNKLCVRRYYQNCKLLLEFYSSFTYQCRHHFENVKLKTVFKLNLIFSPYVVTLRGISVKKEASLCKCDDTAMPLCFKEENMHLISPSFLMGLIQRLF